MKSKSGDKPSVKATLNHLRKFDKAGRIMETDEGVAAPRSCHWCTREGFEVECRVFKEKDDKSCAYCIHYAKPRCTARKVIEEKQEGESAESQQRIAALELQISRLESTVVALDEKLSAPSSVASGESSESQQRVAALELQISRLESIVFALDEKLSAPGAVACGDASIAGGESAESQQRVAALENELGILRSALVHQGTLNTEFGKKDEQQWEWIRFLHKTGSHMPEDFLEQHP